MFFVQSATDKQHFKYIGNTMYTCDFIQIYSKLLQIFLKGFSSPLSTNSNSLLVKSRILVVPALSVHLLHSIKQAYSILCPTQQASVATLT